MRIHKYDTGCKQIFRMVRNKKIEKLPILKYIKIEK